MMYLSCTACKMILAMLSNLLWASSLMESCFSCFTVEVLKDFRVMTVVKERSRLVPLKAMPMGNPTPLTNAAIGIPPVITVDVIKPVSTIPVIVLNRFIFWQSVHKLQFHQEKMPQFQSIFLINMFVVLVVP